MPTFQENVAAVVDAVGLEYAKKAPGVVLGFGMTQWDSVEQRDAALQFITSPQQ